MTHIGFTGTQQQLTHYQMCLVEHVLRWHYDNRCTDFHHGDCVGADEFAAKVAYSLGYTVHCHPPINDRYRAYAPTHVMHPELAYLDRNDVIAASVLIGIAAPKEMEEQKRSGTWYTIRRFRRNGVPHWIIGPDRFITVSEQSL